MKATSTDQIQLISAAETGIIDIWQLKRFWSQCLLKRSNQLQGEEWKQDWQINKTLLNLLGVGLEQTIQYVFNDAPSFEEFENWIIRTAGMPAEENIARFNQLFAHDHISAIEKPGFFLTAEQMDCWDKNGYVIIKEAVPAADCAATISMICDFIGIDKDQPDTWYTPHPARQGIMVQLFQHPLLQKNRQSEKIRLAYEQLWNRKDIWVTADRVGFNPPETVSWQFPGPDLHWDCSLTLPIPFGLQGILYLADTAADQGAFTLVPGFQHRIEHWLQSLPPDCNPRTMDLHTLGSEPIVAEAGDFIIWHQALPHGSSPNRSTKPRFVQYINYEPADKSVSTHFS